jgi:hypothetical protein
LKAISAAFVGPDFRLGLNHLPRPKLQANEPADLASEIESLLKSTARKTGHHRGQRRVVLAVGDCSPRLARVISQCFCDSQSWQFRSVHAPDGVSVPAAEGGREVFPFDAGCARAQWPEAWARAHLRVSIAEQGTDRRPSLSLGALRRLVEIFPEQLRTPLRDTPDPQTYALMWLLERHPPHLSIVFAGDTRFYADACVNSQGKLVEFDNAVVAELGLRRSAELEEALRWFDLSP